MASTNRSETAQVPKRKRRWVRVVVVILGILFVAGALAPTLFSGFARGKIESALAAKLRGKATVGDVSLGWLSGASVQDVVIHAPQAGEPSLEVASIKVDVGLFALLTGGGVKGTVDVSGITARARRRHGRVDLTDLVKPDESSDESSDSSLPQIDLRVIVRDLTLSFEDVDAGTPPAVRRINKLEATIATKGAVDVSLDGGPDMEARAVVQAFSGGQVRPADEISASGTLKLRDLDLAPFGSLLEPFLGTVKGKITQLEQAFAYGDGTLKFVGPLNAEALSFAPPGLGAWSLPSVRGRFDMELEGTRWKPGSLDLTVDGLTAKEVPGMALPLGETSLVAKAAFAADQSVQLEQIVLKGPGFDVSGTGKGTYQDESFFGELTVKTRGDVSRLTALVGGLPEMTGALASDIVLKRSPNGNLSVTGKSSIDDFVAKNLPGSVPPVEEKSVKLHHDLSMEQDRWNLANVGIQASFVEATLRGTFTPPQGDRGTPEGDLTFVSRANLSQISALLGNHVPIKLSGNLSTNGKLTGTAEGYRVEADSVGEDLRIEGGPLKGGPLVLGATKIGLRGTANPKGTKGEITALEVTSPLVTAHLSGAFEVQGGALLHAMTQGTAEADVDAFQAAFEKAENPKTFGRSRATFDVTLTEKNLVVKKLDATIMGLTAQASGNLTLPSDGAPLQDGTLECRLQGDLNALRDFMPASLNVKGTTSTTATVSTSAKGYSVSTVVSGQGVEVAGEALQGGPLALGTMKLDLRARADSSARNIDIESCELTSGPLAAKVSGHVTHSKDGTLNFAGKGNASVDVPILARAAMTRTSKLSDLGRGTLQFDAALAGKELTLSQVDADFADLKARLVGKVNLPDAGDFPSLGSATININGALTRVGNLLDLPVDLSGHSEATAHITFGSPLTFTASLKGQKVVARGPSVGPTPVELQDPSGSLSGTYDPDKRLLRLSAAQIQTPFATGSLTEAGQVTDVAGPAMTAKLPMKLVVDLGKIPAGFIPEGTKAAGIVSADFNGGLDQGGPLVERLAASASWVRLERAGDVAMEGPLNVNATTTQGGNFTAKVESTQLRFIRPDGTIVQAPLLLDVQGTRSSTSSRWDLQKMIVRGGGVDASGQLMWNPESNSHIKLKGTLGLDDLAKTFLPLFAPTWQASGRGSLDVDIQAPMGAEQPGKLARGQWNILVDHLATPGLELRNLNTQGRIADGIAVIDRGSANVNQGTAQVTGQIDFRPTKPMWNGTFNAQDVRIQEQWQPAIARVIPLFAGIGVKLNGMLNGNFLVSGVGSNFEDAKPSMNGNGTIGIQQGSLAGGPILSALTQLVGLDGQLQFNPLSTNFKVQNGSVIQEALTLSAHQVDFRMGGRTGLDGTLDHDLGVRIRAGDLSKYQQYTKVLSPDGFIPLRLGGNISSPALKPPDIGKALGNALEGTLKRGLGDLLGGKKDKDKEKKNDP